LPRALPFRPFSQRDSRPPPRGLATPPSVGPCGPSALLRRMAGAGAPDTPTGPVMEPARVALSSRGALASNSSTSSPPNATPRFLALPVVSATSADAISPVTTRGCGRGGRAAGTAAGAPTKGRLGPADARWLWLRPPTDSGSVSTSSSCTRAWQRAWRM
jgi:hypothetical protein